MINAIVTNSCITCEVAISTAPWACVSYSETLAMKAAPWDFVLFADTLAVTTAPFGFGAFNQLCSPIRPSPRNGVHLANTVASNTAP